MLCFSAVILKAVFSTTKKSREGGGQGDDRAPGGWVEAGWGLCPRAHVVGSEQGLLRQAGAVSHRLDRAAGWGPCGGEAVVAAGSWGSSSS